MARIATAGSVGLVAALAVGLGGCSRTQDPGPDPAAANMAPVSETAQMPPQAAPAAQGVPYSSYVQPGADYAAQPGAYDPQTQNAEELSSAPQPPPPLPDYSQPPCPGDNYLWTPGYWAYSPDGYYWVPGAWVMAPFVGALWTPPWWGFAGGHYLWHAGYWGPYVGFYGGINYGFGYTGAGFSGGYWQNGRFDYNRAVLNVRPGVVHEVYDRRAENYTPFNHVSFNGPRGVNAQPNASQTAALRQRRMGPLAAQTQLATESAVNHAQFAAENRGRPAIVATARPIEGGGSGRGAALAGGSAQPTNARPEERTPAPSSQPRAEMPSNNERPRVPQLNQRPVPEQRPEARQGAAAAREPQFGQAPAGRAQSAPLRAMPETPRPAPRQTRPVPEARPEAQAARRPEAQAARRPEAQAARRPEAQPAAHAAPAQAQRPAPQARPQMEQRQARPAPEARPGPPGKEHEK